MADLFFENNSSAVITLDANGRIIAWNPGAERLYGHSRVQALNQSINLIFPPGLPAEYLARQGNLNPTRPVADWHTQQISKGGSRFVACLSLTPFFDKDGKVTATCIVAHEANQATGFASQEQQSQKLEAVGRLAGGIAHDFNNLLTVIAGYNGMLREALPPDSPLLKYASEVKTAADRATSLTNQLLVFSRRAVTAPQVLSINNVLTDLKRMLSRIIGTNIEIQLDLDPNLAYISADPGQLSQLLMNLALNARDAMPRGGVLRFATSNLEKSARPVEGASEPSQTAGLVKIEISDNGSGMDEDTKAHLFEPFFTTKGRSKGTGLGLSIVYGIVSRLSGQITVVSEPDRGCCFTITLPASLATEEINNVAEVSPSTSLPAGQTILLVEDEDGVRSLVKEMLQIQGYGVIAAGTPAEAIRLSKEAPIDLLLTDLVMPKMRGGELAMHLQETLPTLRVLYMSGFADDFELSEKFLRTSGNYVQKPFTAAQLIKQVRQALQVTHVATLHRAFEQP